MRLSGRRAERSAATDDGRMSLVEHLRELRNRLAWSFLGIGLGLIVGWIF